MKILINGCLGLVFGLLFVALVGVIGTSFLVSSELNSRGLPQVTVTSSDSTTTSTNEKPKHFIGSYDFDKFTTPEYLEINGKKVPVKKAEKK